MITNTKVYKYLRVLYSMEIYSEQAMLRTPDNVELETCSHYSDNEAPSLVFATGLGGSAKLEPSFLEKFGQEFNITSFSPRNSGRSTGNLTIDNYVSDLNLVIDNVSQKRGEIPYGIGHSTGGYCLGYLLGQRPVVKRAVLLDPLTDMSEQNPEILNALFRYIARNKLPKFLFKDRYKIGNQRFQREDISSFLKSLFNEQGCFDTLKSPTLVFLTRGNYPRLPKSTRRLSYLKEHWTSLEANVEVFPQMNHYFSGNWYQGLGDVFSELPEEKIKDFLLNVQTQ